MQRAIWYKWHSWCGVHLAVFLCFVLVTGTLAVVANELDWLSNPAIRAVPDHPDQAVNWPAIYRSALAQVDDEQLMSLSAPLHPGYAASLVVKRPNNTRYRWYFHPSTGQYQGQGSWFNWQTVLRRIHRHLMLPVTLGTTLVCITAFLFLGLSITGLGLHKRWLSGLIARPRSKSRRLFWTDIHKLAGLWSVWLLLIVSLTGVWYLVERWGGHASYPVNSKPTGVSSTGVPELSVAQFSAILKQVSEHSAEFDIRHIRFPNKADSPLLVEGQGEQVLVRNRANNFAFNPYDGNLLSRRDGAQLSLHVRISEAADPLHFGTWGGFPSKVIYFVFGVILSGLSITGTYLYALKVSGGSQYRHASAMVKWRNAWHHFGGIKWLSVSLVVVAFIGFAVQLVMDALK